MHKFTGGRVFRGGSAGSARRADEARPPLGVWRPRLSDPHMARLLMAIAGVASRLVTQERRRPSPDEVAALVYGKPQADIRLLAAAVMRAEVWDTPATDPQWTWVNPGPTEWRVRRVRLTECVPAVLLRHGRNGVCYAHWLNEPYAAGGWAWTYLHILGAGVIRRLKLDPRRVRVVGSLSLIGDNVEIARRILPEHVAAAEAVARSAVLFRDVRSWHAPSPTHTSCQPSSASTRSERVTGPFAARTVPSLPVARP